MEKTLVLMLYLFFLLFCYSETEEAVLRVLGVSVEDSGVYTCVATNVAGSVTSSASLRVSGESLVMLQGEPFKYLFASEPPGSVL